MVSRSTYNVEKLLNIYREKVYKANKTLNLVSRQNVKYILNKLIEESLLPLEWEVCSVNSPLIDIGSGAGIPGIPLGVAKSLATVVLVDSNRRKSTFLRRMSTITGFESLRVENQRAEKLCLDPSYQNEFNTFVSRGVGNLENLLRWAHILLKPGGEFIAWKGSALYSELAGLDLSGWEDSARLTQPDGLTLFRLLKS